MSIADLSSGSGVCIYLWNCRMGGGNHCGALAIDTVFQLHGYNFK